MERPFERNDEIQAELDRIERDGGVRVLYACESGSRAWGFASGDSDFDVRFVYLRPARWYLTVQDRRDVIERPISDDLDISGWDLPKALGLFAKSNPPLLEWLGSPIVYREAGLAAGRLRDLLADFYSPVSCMYHYLHMARGNHRQYLQGDEVWVKKYFYVLRPVLACLWIERGLGVVPTEFGKLVEALIDDPALRRVVDDLVARKRAGGELDRGPRIDPLSEFIDREILRLSAEGQPAPAAADPEALDRLFVDALIETWGDRLG